MNETHRQYWQALREGDEKALFSLYEVFYADLMRVGRLLSYQTDLSRDTVGEVFLELWERRHRLPEVDNLRAYLSTIYKRKLMGEIVEGRRLETWEADTYDQGEDETFLSGLIETESQTALKKHLLLAIEQLPKRQRELLRLRFYENLSYDEITLRTNLAHRTVYNKIHEALKTLRESPLVKGLL